MAADARTHGRTRPTSRLARLAQWLRTALGASRLHRTISIVSETDDAIQLDASGYGLTADRTTGVIRIARGAVSPIGGIEAIEVVRHPVGEDDPCYELRLRTINGHTISYCKARDELGVAIAAAHLARVCGKDVIADYSK